MSNYPAQIDTSQSLPTVIDGQTPVRGAIFNKLRDAIIAIESELGIEPSSIYTTVKARLDNNDAIVNNFNDIFVKLGGDLGNTVDMPRVIKIQNNLVSSAAPLINQFFKWNGISWSPTYVDSIWGRTIDNSSPQIGQIYKWDGLKWISSDIAGNGLIFANGLHNVGQNIDNTIVINTNDIQLNPSFYTSEAIPLTLVERDGNGKITLSDGDGTFTSYGNNIIQAVSTINDTTGTSLTLQSQNATGSNTTGGNVIVQSGTGTNIAGDVIIKNGTQTNTTFSSTTLATNVKFVTFGDISDDLLISQSDSVGVTGKNLTIRAQAAAGGIGGNLILQSGDGLLPGNVELRVNGSNSSIVLDSQNITIGAGIDNVVASLPQSITNSFTGKQLTIQGQNCTGTSSIGGDVYVSSGFGTTKSGILNLESGNVSIQLKTITDTFGMIDLTCGGNNSHIALNTISIRVGTGIDNSRINPPDLDGDSVTGITLTLEGQDCSGSLTTGGNLVILGGFGTSFGGDVRVSGGNGGVVGNIGLGSNTISAGGGHGVIFISQDVTDPTTNPVGGIILYVDSSGNLKARTSAGNVRTICLV